MTASFIPVFTGYMREKDKEEVWEFANKLFWTLALVVAVITVLGMVFSPYVIHLFASNANKDGLLGSGDRAESNHFPVSVFRGAGGAGDGNSELLSRLRIAGGDAGVSESGNDSVFGWRRFGNISQDPATSLAVGVLVGGVLQFLIQVPSLVQKGMTFKFGISFSHPGIRNVARLMIPRLFGIGIGQINLLLIRDLRRQRIMPSGKFDGAVFVRSRDGTGAGWIRHRGGHGDSADDVAPGGGERLRGTEEDAGFRGAASWRSLPYRRRWD